MTGEPNPESTEPQEKVLRTVREKADFAHHRIPLFDLRSFVGENGRITILDPGSGDTRSTAPVLFFENHGSRA